MCYNKQGIRGNIFNWFKSYLSNRKQFVYLNKTKSNTKLIKCGIPQGSFLGPLLFVLYINDPSKISEHLFTIMYADDTIVFLEGETISKTINIFNSELQKLTSKTHFKNSLQKLTS